jgi:DNA-binding CsgD family transcriptional regulator
MNEKRVTKRQAQVLLLVAKGYIVKEIATMLGISEGSVVNHKCFSYALLGFHNSVDVAHWAIQHNFVKAKSKALPPRVENWDELTNWINTIPYSNES